MSLVHLLNNEDVLVQDVAEKFTNAFLANQEDGTADFVELLFHAGGWSTFVYLGPSFPQKQEFSDIKATHELFAPIANKEIDFQKRFSDFLSIVLESNKCCLVYKEHFMCVVVRAYQILSCGKWDMFRLIAQILGMKMLCSLNKEYEKLKSNSMVSETGNPMALTRVGRTNLAYHGWQQSFLKIYHLIQFFVYKTLCEKCQGQGTADIVASPFCRLTNLLNELMISTNLPPTPMYKDRWLSLILNGIRDKNYDHRGLCFMVLYLLLRRLEDPRWQMKLFEFIKSDLFYALRMCTDFSYISMRIISSVASWGKITLSLFECNTIYFYLFNSDQSIAILAAQVVFNHIIVRTDPFFVLSNLSTVCRTSFIRCDELLIDSFYDELKPIMTWDDWADTIHRSSKDLSEDVMTFLCAYVHKTTTGFTPRFRTTIVREISYEEMNESRKSFTNCFKREWFLILELEKIRENPKSLAKLIKLPQYFDEDIISKESDVLRDISEVCLAYISIGNEPCVVEESCNTLAKIRHFSKNKLHQEVNIIISAAIKLIFQDFKKFQCDEMSRSKILFAAEFFEVDNLGLWETSLEKLNCVSDLKENPNLATMLISLLYLLLTKKAERTINELSKTKTSNVKIVNAFINDCLCRSVALQTLIRPFIAPGFSPELRKAAFMTTLDLLEFMGPHVDPPKGVWYSTTSFPDEDIGEVIAYTIEMIKGSNSCQANHLSFAKLEHCCAVLYKTCVFISKGILDVTWLTPLMRYLGKNSIHDDIIVECINKFTNRFPHKWENLSNAMFNTYAVIKEECMPEDVPLQDTPEVRASMAKLFAEMSALTQVLTRRVRVTDPRTLRKVSIRLHTVLIDRALRPSGFRSSIDLLYAIRELLADQDVQFILTCLDEYHDFGAEVVKYSNFLKQSFSLQPIFFPERDDLHLLAGYPLL